MRWFIITLALAGSPGEGYVYDGSGGGGGGSFTGGTVTSPILFPDGTASAPSIAFSAESDLGFYRTGTPPGVVRLSNSDGNYGFAFNTGGGSLTLQSNWDIGLQGAGATINNSSAPVVLGAYAVTTHSLTSGDTLATGELEVDGDAYFDNQVGIGATTPQAMLHVVSEGPSTFWTERYGATPVMFFRRANGTEASPTRTNTGEEILQISSQGYHDGGSWGSNASALIAFRAAENFTSNTNLGANIVLETIPTGSGTRFVRMTIAHDGEVDIASVSGDGTGKVVCIKSDGNLGTCTTTVGAGGTCTCS